MIVRAYTRARAKNSWIVYPYLIRSQNNSSSMADENKQNILQTTGLEERMQSTAGNVPEHGMRQTWNLYLESQSLQ